MIYKAALEQRNFSASNICLQISIQRQSQSIYWNEWMFDKKLQRTLGHPQAKLGKRVNISPSLPLLQILEHVVS
jgi:hypothetical protein